MFENYPPYEEKIEPFLTQDIDDQEVAGGLGIGDPDEAAEPGTEPPEMTSFGHIFRGWWGNNWHKD